MKMLLNLFVLSFIVIVTGDSCKDNEYRDNSGHNTPLAVNKTEIVFSGEKLPETFLDISFLDETTGWAISSKSLWKTSDKGRSWTRLRTFEGEKVGFINYSAELSQIQTISKDKVLIQGGLRGLVQLNETGDEVKILFDKGIVRAFHFLDEKNGWVVGQSSTKGGGNWDATAYKTKDGGNSWEPIHLDIADDCNCALYDILALDAQSIFLVGDFIAKTDDGGRNFSVIESFGSLEGKIYGITGSMQALNKNFLWIVSNQGNKFLVSSNGGKSWKTRSLPSESQIYDLKFIDRERVIALSSNVIWESFDSGVTWGKKQELSDFALSLYQFPNSNNLYLVGDVFRPVSPE